VKINNFKTMVVQSLDLFQPNEEKDVRSSIGKRKPISKTFIALAIFAIASIVVNKIAFRDSERRNLSISFTNGDCLWTDSQPLDENIINPYGTLFASYPAAGMRVTWQQTEGATGIKVSDDFFQLAYAKVGIVKTQYPHYEGIWSYGSNMNQVIYVIRNPRWGMPSYLTILSELNYAHTWELAYDYLPEVFTKRAPMDDWIKWRDYRFNDEMRLWGLHIDFFMSDGDQYWMPVDFERNGQWPFRYYNESDRPWPKDYHCANDIDSCVPVAIISYERIRDPVHGPGELHKIANALRGKHGMTVLPDDNIECIWHDTWVSTLAPYNDNRDRNGLPRTAYSFTLEQMYKMKDKLEEYETKYSSESWANMTQAQDLVWNFQYYLDEVREEIAQMEANPPPTTAPDAGYHDELVAWYNSKGKGNRYDKGKVQNMGIWELVKQFYGE